MSSSQRIFIKNEWYHIYNRGNHRENIFRDRYDYLRFKRKLIDLRDEYKVNISSYILKSNHFHLLCSPTNNRNNISLLISRLMNSYTKCFNIKYNEVGRLVQDRFRSKHIGTEENLLHLSRYIHLNAIDHIRLTPEVTLRSQLDKYQHSSWQEYLTGQFIVVNSTDIILGQYNGTSKRKKYLKFVDEYMAMHISRKGILRDIQDNLE